MKLAKKISKGIALCAALAIMGTMGGVLTSCSNGSDDAGPELPSEEDKDVLEGWTAITIGEVEKYNGQDGKSSYAVTKNNNGSITISHDAAMALYASCSFKPNFGENNTLYTKITNNADVDATVQVQVNKAGTEANNYEPTATVAAVYVDGKKQTDAGAYSVEYKIPAKGSVVIVNKFDLSKKPDTVSISLNSQEKVAGTVEKGNITVSGISMKTVTDEKELATAEEDKTEQKPEGDKTPDTAKPEENKKPDATNPVEDTDPKDPPAGDEEENPPAKPEETVIFSEEKEITWSEFLTIESSKFDGEAPKTISIYFDCVERDDKYVAMKIAANYENATLGDGTVVGGSLKADDKGALEGLGNPGDTGKVVSYTPTADEWNDKITKTGFYVNGYGVIIKKVTLK